MAEMGFEPGLIGEVAGLPRGTVNDIIRGHGPWREMPNNQLVEITRLRLKAGIENAADSLAMKAMAKLEEKIKTASFMELINFVGVGLNKGDAWR